MFSYIRHSFLHLHNIISFFSRFVKFCVYISILTPYFVQGYGGILELMDVWIRYEYSELAMKENYPPGHIRVDEECMKKAYQIWYEKLKNAKYLKLELQPGDDPKTSDFNPNEEDFKKKKYFRKSIYHDEDAVDNQFAKWNYGVNTDYSVATMDRWNMTTHLNHEGEKVIPPEKIKIIQDNRGRTDAKFIRSFK